MASPCAEDIAADKPQTAIEQGDRIENQINMPADCAEMGRPRRKRGTRELVISQTPFVVVYQVRQ